MAIIVVLLLACGLGSGVVAQESTPATEDAAGGATPQAVFAAALDGRGGVVAKALDGGFAVDRRDRNGRTALMLAAFNGNREIVEMLLRAGADCELTDPQGRSALMFACTGAFAGCVRMLVDAGSDVNLSDEVEHWTPLMFAAGEGQTEVVRVLLENGAEPGARDEDDDTAASFAKRRGHAETLAVLEASKPPMD